MANPVYFISDVLEQELHLSPTVRGPREIKARQMQKEKRREGWFYMPGHKKRGRLRNVICDLPPFRSTNNNTGYSRQRTLGMNCCKSKCIVVMHIRLSKCRDDESNIWMICTKALALLSDAIKIMKVSWWDFWSQ